MRQGFLVMATPSNCELFGSSWKAGGVNKGLGEAPKSCTRKEHESATNSIAERGQGGTSSLFVCPLRGLGQRPNCSASDHHLKCTQQRRRQRSVPASNFARPQTRPQAALPPRFREEPKKTRQEADFFSPLPRVNISLLLLQIRRHHIPCVPVVSHLRPRFARGEHNHR